MDACPVKIRKNLHTMDQKICRFYNVIARIRLNSRLTGRLSHMTGFSRKQTMMK